jgi:2-amino-4-hydroxy-6-hydroxymethyldihydropteridine diphosphokinase
MKTVYLGIGSNKGDRHGNLAGAVRSLGGILTVQRLSSLYETAPMELTDQPWFLNQVIEAGTGLFPLQLLAAIGKVEMAFGRQRTVPKGPRTLDIDILLYANAVIRTPVLQVPHPEFRNRRFVLEPLAELNPDLRDPITRKTVRELLGQVRDQPVRKLAGWYAADSERNSAKRAEHSESATTAGLD